MTIQLSVKINSIKPSPTLAVTNKANELKAKGIDIIGLGAGEPDFDTPAHIREAAINAINTGNNKYTPVSGIPKLRAAIVNKFKRENNIEYTDAQVMVSTGAKQCIYNLAQVILNPEDEVIIPAPYWVSYPDICILTGAKPVIINTGIETRFKITANDLEKAITAKTKMLILNSPSNPTGSSYSKEELISIANVLKKHPNIIILSDDIYEHILWNGSEFINILNVCPELYNQTIVINGVSKAYSMTGWRIGYAAGPENVIKAMTKIQGQCTSNACSIAQHAATAALDGGIECVQEMVKEFKARHDFVVAELNKIPGVECIESDGTFYAFPKFTKAIENIPDINDDIELAEKLLSDAKVAVVPGSAFGAPGYARLSYATSMDNLQKALSRMQDFFAKYNQ